MHKIVILPGVLPSAQGRRGRTCAWDQLNLARSAHLVVDLQNELWEQGRGRGTV